jgi:hypothetical protein
MMQRKVDFENGAFVEGALKAYLASMGCNHLLGYIEAQAQPTDILMVYGSFKALKNPPVIEFGDANAIVFN